jgi:hypothetical protein
MRRLFTGPYRPRTNGKAERFIQTLTNRCGHLGHRPPAARLAELEQRHG